jgi:hypothetical protein
MKLKKKKKIKGQDHGLAYMNREEMKAMNAMKNSPGFIGRMARVGEKMPMVEKDGIPTFVEITDDETTVEDMQAAGLDYSSPGSNPGSDPGSGGGSGGGGQSAPQMTRQQAMEQFGLMDAVDLDEIKKTAGDEALQTQRDSARQGRVNEYEEYKTRMRGMEDDYDLSGERDAVRGYAGQAATVGSDFDRRMSGMADKYSGMSGYESDVAGLRGDVSSMRGDVGKLSAEAMDREALMKDRGFYSGLAESARKSQQRGAEEQLMRGMSGAGSSPEQIALAKAKLQSSGEAARRDSLGAAQAAMGARQQQLSQGAGLMGQQAGLLGQQAGLTGQAQGLGMNRLGAVGQTYGNMANMGLGVLGQQAGFQGQSAGLLTQQMQGLGQLMQGQVGMTDAQLGDIRERDNMAFQERMADKNAEAQIAAAEAQKSGGGGGGCCWIMLEARYGDGTMDDVVRRYRDEVLCPRKRRGYYRMAKVLVPLMRKSKVFKQIVAWTFADPLVAWGEWYYGKNKWGWIMSPIKNFWMGTLYVVGGETEFIRENGEVV